VRDAVRYWPEVKVQAREQRRYAGTVSGLPVLPVVPSAPSRGALVRRAQLLAGIGVAWHVLETAVAILAGLAASSVALVGFGADSLVESVAGIVVLWRFAARRVTSDTAERRAQRLIGGSFYVIAAYVAIEAVRSLIGGDEPSVSWVGIGLAAVTTVAMPPLAIAKGRLGAALNSSATASEGRQNMVCAYLSVGLLVGLGANAALGWWWADPAVALVIAAVAVREGRHAWRGEDACCAVPGLERPGCADECCGSPQR
jgi:divalent metal cation (Fe/Co/Zn/Cd) transporter